MNKHVSQAVDANLPLSLILRICCTVIIGFGLEGSSKLIGGLEDSGKLTCGLDSEFSGGSGCGICGFRIFGVSGRYKDYGDASIPMDGGTEGRVTFQKFSHLSSPPEGNFWCKRADFQKM